MVEGKAIPWMKPTKQPPEIIAKFEATKAYPFFHPDGHEPPLCTRITFRSFLSPASEKNEAPGTHPIPTKLFSLFGKELEATVLAFYNRPLGGGVVPDHCKEASARFLCMNQ